MLEPWVSDFIASLLAYQDGYLPAAGGFTDQSHVWQDAVRVAIPHLRECQRIAAIREAAKNRV